VSGEAADRYKFRTPSPRQVAFTGSWGHDGAYDTLQAVIRHHLDPVARLSDYDASQLRLPSRSDLDAKDLIAHTDASRRGAIAASNQLSPVVLSDKEVSNLTEFLTVGLTDASCVDLRSDVPVRVPSGLSLAD
jgi:cytochrome c peroxidase